MNTSLPSMIRSSLRTFLLLSILACTAASLTAAPDQNQPATAQSFSVKYKVISGFKQPFNDDLQLHLSQGWTPVGGISVTVWNNDLYFSQLISKPASE